MRRKGTRIVAWTVCTAMLTFSLSGCKKVAVEVPELLAPAATNESYRPVEYGDVGNIDVQFGTVVPTDYCHFWKTPVTIGQIEVDIGDYVEAGTVLVYADINSAQEQIEQLNKELTLENSLYTSNEELYQLKHQELELKKNGAEQLGDSEGAALVATEIAVLEENHRYDGLLHQYKLREMNERVAEQQEIVADGTMTARVSGYVTYVKDISMGGAVNGSENVVIVSDYNDCYVEISDITVSEKFRRDFMPYDRYYTEIAGKKYDLKEYEYTPQERVVIEDRSQYPCMRMQFEDKSAMPEVGTNIPIFMTGDIVEDVLIVGNDSLYADSKGNFVYVKENGSRVIRYVELGKTGRNYTEVVSGLSEGEMIYYSSSSILPDSYTEFEVVPTDYEPKKTTDSYSEENVRKTVYNSEFEGRITSVSVKEGDEVGKGDLICTVKTNEGSAKLTEMSNAISAYKEQYAKAVDGYTVQIQELENQMADILRAEQEQQTPPAEPEPGSPTEPQPEAGVPTATETDAGTEPESKPDDNSETEPDLDITEGTAEDKTPDSEEQETEVTPTEPEPPQDPNLYQELALQIEQIKIEQKKSTLNYNYQLAIMESDYSKVSCNNDGGGYVNIYAETAGVISGISVKDGKVVKVGDRLFNIGVPAADKVLLRCTDSLKLNQPLVFKDKSSDASYTGRISGVTGGGDRVYVTTMDGRVYLTTNVSTDGNPLRYYVVMDDSGFYGRDDRCSVEYSVNTIHDSFVLPDDGVVYTEVGEGKNKDVIYHYVWRLVDGNFVKQYVTITENSINGSTKRCAIAGLKAGDILAQEESE